MADFAPGDVVTLKSGGPRMTVIKTFDNPIEPGTFVACSWFDDKKALQHANFALQTIEKN